MDTQRGDWPARHKALTAVGALTVLLVVAGVAGAGDKTDPSAAPRPAATEQPAEQPADQPADQPTEEPTEEVTAEPAVAATTPAPKPVLDLVAPTTTAPKPAPKPSPKPAPKPVPVRTTAAPALDPRFGTCKEAIANGYGPYYAGSDPEYWWYIDRDHDGVDCE
jgi:outer membrane biosynthesis protein TonB